MDSLDLLVYQEGGTSGVIYPSSEGVAEHAVINHRVPAFGNRLCARHISVQLTSEIGQGMCKALLPALKSPNSRRPCIPISRPMLLLQVLRI